MEVPAAQNRPVQSDLFSSPLPTSGRTDRLRNFSCNNSTHADLSDEASAKSDTPIRRYADTSLRPQTPQFLKRVWKFFAFTLLLCAGCQQTKTHPPIVAQTPNYLNAGDTVRITFPAAPELNQSQKIGTGRLT
jgi:hypothetical protein